MANPATEFDSIINPDPLPQRDIPHPHAMVTFFSDPNGKINIRKSRKAKAPVFDDVEKVRFQFVGDQKFSPVYFANEESDYRLPGGRRLTYKEAFPELYAAFKAGHDQVQGTPIDVLPLLTPAQLSTLKASRIVSVEQLAAVEGKALSALGLAGGRDLKEMAQNHLESLSQNQEFKELMAENEALKARLDRLEDMAGTGKGKAAAKEEDSPAPDLFADWDEATITVYITDRGRKPPAKATRAQLLKIANELAKDLETEKA